MARTLRLLFAFLTITIVTVALAGKLYAADWPVKPVTVIVPFGAGGNTDMMARIAAQRLSAKFGQSFVVENRPSAGGALGTGQVAASAPDGYTLLFAASSMIALTPQLQKLNYDPMKQLVPITNMGTGTQMIAIKRALPPKTLPEFIEYAKANQGGLTTHRGRYAEYQPSRPCPAVCPCGNRSSDGAGQKRATGGVRSDVWAGRIFTRQFVRAAAANQQR